MYGACKLCTKLSNITYIDVSSPNKQEWKEYYLCSDCLKEVNRTKNWKAYQEQDRRDRQKGG
jgi:ribosomal protein L28